MSTRVTPRKVGWDAVIKYTERKATDADGFMRLHPVGTGIGRVTEAIARLACLRHSMDLSAVMEDLSRTPHALPISASIVSTARDYTESVLSDRGNGTWAEGMSHDLFGDEEGGAGPAAHDADAPFGRDPAREVTEAERYEQRMRSMMKAFARAASSAPVHPESKVHALAIAGMINDWLDHDMDGSMEREWRSVVAGLSDVIECMSLGAREEEPRGFTRRK